MIKYVTRLALALIVLVALTVSLSTPAQAQEPTIDLELGGPGATSWDITDIKPGYSGTKTVTLHNAGDVDGFVTIWISDLVSSEGVNPESETGDTGEPGELDDYFLFNISCSWLQTNISLPTTIDNLPQSASSWRYLRVTPLNVGETVTLDWQWELPIETDNDAQGDRLSFTINYMLEEFPPRPPVGGVGGITRYLRVDLWGEEFKTRVTSAGEVRADLEAVSIDEMVTLYITKGVLAQTEDEERLRKIEVLPMAEPPPLPENGYIIGLAYDFIPAGATFDPAIELEIRYDPSQIPDGLDEENLLIAYYDEEVGEWLELDGVVDTVGNTITAEVSHFTAFAILGYRVVVPAPAAFTISKLIISPAEVDIGQSVTISAIVTNTGGEVGIYEVVLEVDGIVEDTEKVVVSAGASKKVTFTTAKDVAGSYSVDVNRLSGLFTVKAAPPPPPPPPPTPIPPTPEVKPAINWPLVGGIIAGVVLVGLGVFFWIRRRAIG